MKVLITGASGFIGNAMLSHFKGLGEVTGLDLNPDPAKNILAHDDFEATRALIAQSAFDLLINCAGASDVQHSYRAPAGDFKLNTIYVEQILEALREFSPATKFVNFSSAAVYGNPKTLPVTENDPCQPLSPYGLHKLLSEQLTKSYHTFYQVPTLSVRIFSAYGPGLKRQFFYDLYSKFKAGNESVSLAGTGKESRDFIFIDDIVKAVVLLTERGRFDGGVYNLANAEETFIDDASLLFAKICGYKGKIQFSQRQFAGYPLNWKADTGKLTSLGFFPKTRMSDGLSLYHNWIKDL
ncbi:MAG: NAD-dependent epimerase/dehydratase family protein [Bacteroidota bacterium]